MVFQVLSGCKVSLENIRGDESYCELDWIIGTISEALRKCYFPANGITDDFHIWRMRKRVDKELINFTFGKHPNDIHVKCANFPTTSHVQIHIRLKTFV